MTNLVPTTSRVVIYDKSGATLGEILEPSVRTWTINKYGQAEFVIAKTNPMFTEKNLRDGNLINIYGTHLPPWSGVITSNRKWMRDGTLVVTCYGAPYLLSNREALVNYSGTTAGIFSKLINDANARETLPIYPGSIYDDGVILSGGQAVGSPGSSLYDVLQSTFTLSFLEYSFDLAPDQYGKVQFSANVLPSLGQTFTAPLEEGFNVMLPEGLILQELGDITNRVYGFQQGNPTPVITVEDIASRSQYGLRESSIMVQSGVDPTVFVKAALATRKQPVRNWTIVAQDVDGLTFSRLGLGNQMPYISHNVGFDPQTGAVGGIKTIRITSMTFSDATGECLLTVQEVVS